MNCLLSAPARPFCPRRACVERARAAAVQPVIDLVLPPVFPGLDLRLHADPFPRSVLGRFVTTECCRLQDTSCGPASCLGISHTRRLPLPDRPAVHRAALEPLERTPSPAPVSTAQVDDKTLAMSPAAMAQALPPVHTRAASESGHSSCTTLAEGWLPAHLALYLVDQPMPAAVFAHASLTEPIKPNSLEKLAPPVYENPAMRSLLQQGSGAAHRFNGAATEVPAIPASLSETLNERNQVKLRRWLTTGAEEAINNITSKHHHHHTAGLASPVPSNGSAPQLPQIKRQNSTKPFPSPGLRSPALATTLAAAKANGDGPGSFPFGNVAAAAEQAPKSTEPSGSSPSSSAPTSLSRRTSVSSNSTAATSTAATTSWHARQISLQLATSVNFSKTHWRGTVFPDLGITILTQLPSSLVANGGIGSTEEEDRDVREMPLGSAVSASSHATAGDQAIAEEDAAAMVQRECAEGVAAWEEASTIAGKMELDDGINLENLDAPDFDRDDEEIADASRSETPDGSVGSSALSEASRLPVSVLLARERLGKPVETEPIGDVEVSIEGALDPTSLHGMAYTLWHAPIGCFRVNRDLAITQTNPKWRQTVGLEHGENNDSWPSRVHQEDREKVVKHYYRIAEELPIERDEYEFRWMPDGSGDRWCTCVIEPAIVNGVLAGYTGYLVK